MTFMLAHKADMDENYRGWWASEKMDGFRAMWSSKLKMFLSRKKREILVPEELLSFMRMHFSHTDLDGELWAGRGRLRNVQRVCNPMRAEAPSAKEWSDARMQFRVFDLPQEVSLPFEERQTRLRHAVKKCHDMSGETQFVRWTRQHKLETRTDLDRMFHDIKSNGGEGIMLRRPQSLYRGNHRSHDMLKVKKRATW